ncbi:MAG: SusC/RagA family TonB-linked outer membrane protein [Bacteroidaceae bacterium]|nr:SusC/RagA family TonB-linked outer membrane protein [Bacteroidaceae bacterium]
MKTTKRYIVRLRRLPAIWLLTAIALGEPILSFGAVSMTAQTDTTKQTAKPATGMVAATQVMPNTIAAKLLQGRVCDTNGDPLIGVNVRTNQPDISGVTNENGDFSIPVKNEVKITELIFTYVGMETERRSWNGKRLNVTMHENAQLEEVVVTGLFNYRSSSFTGSAATFTQDDLKGMGNANVLKSLSNLDPTFVIDDNYANGSNPNQRNDISIRGNASFAGLQGEYDGNPNEPLFIVDGFESTYEAVHDLDMNRVVSITILKDAQAKAIYGAKAANGVVVVETKEPESGRLRVTYTGDLNVEMPDLSSYNMCNAKEKLQVEWNSGRYSGGSPAFDQALYEQYNALQKSVAMGVDTYWLSQPLRTGVGHKHTVYFEGGDERMRYSANLDYNSVEGAMKGSNRRTLSGNIKLSYRYKNLLFRNSLSVTANTANNSPYGTFSDYITANPYFTPYDENGNVSKVLGYYTFPSVNGASLNVTYYNPLYNATIGTKSLSKYTDIVENFYIEYRPITELRFTARIGYTHHISNAQNFKPGDHTDFVTWTGDRYYQRGSYYMSDGVSGNLSSDIIANFSKQWNDHFFIASASWSLNQTSSDSHGMTAWGFLNNHVDHITFAKQYAENGKPSGSESLTRSIGFTGTANYSLMDRYMIDASVRYNGSSVYGSDNRWGLFWSTGLGWNIHREPWIQRLGFVDLLKLRGSYGYTGTQNFSPYQAKATYTYYDNIIYDNITGAYLMAMSNSKLKWQQTAELNIGFDMQLFKRLNVRFDWYNQLTKDALQSVTIPTSTGFSSYIENLGKVQNRGFEITANWRFFQKNGSYLSLNASIAHNENKVKEINNALKSFNDSQDATATTSPVLRYEEGQSMSAIWAVKSLGIDPATGREVFVRKDGTTTYNWSATDYQVCGDSNPKYHGNFGLSGEVKGIGMNVSFAYKLGGDIYNQTLVDRVENVNVAYNVDRRVLTSTWNKVGDIATFKHISYTPSTTYATSRFVEKNNILQFAALSCYYDFKYNSWLKNSFLERLKVTFYMTDVFHISTVRTERGYDYPYARTFSLSVTATL